MRGGRRWGFVRGFGIDGCLTVGVRSLVRLLRQAAQPVRAAA